MAVCSHYRFVGALVCDSCGDCADLRHCLETNDVGIAGDCGDRVASMVAVSVFYNETKLQRAAIAAVSGASANTQDDYARLMTCNVFKGRADAQEIVDVVRSERVEVLALQETTDAFVDELNKAGIGDLLPYAQVASSDGEFGNGLWSASPLVDPADDDVDSSASFMPGATVAFNDGRTQIRFVSVHTTSPTDGYWQQWKRSLDELGRLGTIRLAGTCSWAISTRPTIMRRSVISWEHGSRMRPNKRPGIGVHVACEYRLCADVCGH